ncbi:uncharacterized protein LW93_3951 [Fusarium fujikuroi]|nr:uncharacterized protein LW93_3951 [Fusarium fujikuroi]
MQHTDMVWYFAYGSNMASTTLRRRQLNPRDSRPVVVSSHVLCFDVFGVPYKEPAMAGIRERTSVDDTKATPSVHGMAYLLSREEYHRLIVSEGAGVAYVEMELIARTCSTVFTERAATCEEIPVWTLMARFPFRPEALPSVRYMVGTAGQCFESDLTSEGTIDSGSRTIRPASLIPRLSTGFNCVSQKSFQVRRTRRVAPGRLLDACNQWYNEESQAEN